MHNGRCVRPLLFAEGLYFRYQHRTRAAETLAAAHFPWNTGYFAGAAINARATAAQASTCW
jgi:hypothetical protein